jgi:hypothetical protein
MKTFASFALLVLSVPIVAMAQETGGVKVVAKFTPGTDQPLTRTGVTVAEGGWRIQPGSAGSVRLFEVARPLCEACRVLYRAKIKAQDLPAPAFLELWVRVPEKGQFFSRGLDQQVVGSIDWTSVEIPFFFQKGQRADLAKLNVSFGAAGGSLWIKDVELLTAPLP